MATKQKACPISVAHRATNIGNALKITKRRYRDDWKNLHEQREQKRFFAEHWGPCVAKLRRVFRAEFRGPAWKGLSLEWLGYGYSLNHVTHQVKPCLHYRAFWRGMWFERTFLPDSIDDVIAETWKLGAALARLADHEDGK